MTYWWKIIGIMLIIGLLAGCGAVSTTQPAAKETAPVLLGFANVVAGYEFAIPTRQGIEAEAKKRGWEVLLLNNNFDADLALTNANSMVLQGVEIALDFQLYEDAMPAMKAKFNEANIPVITIDMAALGGTFVGVDNYQAGRLAG